MRHQETLLKRTQSAQRRVVTASVFDRNRKLAAPADREEGGNLRMNG